MPVVMHIRVMHFVVNATVTREFPSKGSVKLSLSLLIIVYIWGLLEKLTGMLCPLGFEGHLPW